MGIFDVLLEECEHDFMGEWWSEVDHEMWVAANGDWQQAMLSVPARQTTRDEVFQLAYAENISQGAVRNMMFTHFPDETDDRGTRYTFPIYYHNEPNVRRAITYGPKRINGKYQRDQYCCWAS